MITYICDKCGEHIYRVLMTTMTIEKHDGAEVTTDEYHFCPECTRKFIEWTEEK